MPVDPAALARTLENAREQLLSCRTVCGYWEGRLSSSALSTATAVIAFQMLSRARLDSARADSYCDLIDLGIRWLAAHQNLDGGWGDTPDSLSNISTTALCWAALVGHERKPTCERVADRAASWLRRAAGDLEPATLARAIANRYGRDRTFSVPILSTLALTGRLGADRGGWRLVPPLPFELAVLPPQLFGWLRLPVVSYALPALIAIGQLGHRFRPADSPLVHEIREWARPRAMRVLDEIQPSNGGFLEAAPLTSFVVTSLAAIGQVDHVVTQRGAAFLAASIRSDGSWPIDTNLATWVTTLSVNALSASPDMGLGVTAEQEREALVEWLLHQQHVKEHPYTRAEPGGWAWTDLPGGVPDADDTAGALLALWHLSTPSAPRRIIDAAHAGIKWLLQLQNRDGGIPTFCRGWGYLPFDRSSPDLTAHALRAWTAWRDLCPERTRAIDRAIRRGARYLSWAQHWDGGWVPLWFGNESAPGEENLTYGTTRVMLALADMDGRGGSMPAGVLDRARRWLVMAQNVDGGWGGAPGVDSSIEETALAVDALAAVAQDQSHLMSALHRGVDWLIARTEEGRQFAPSPIGFYFAKLWYSEELYPIIFTVAALGRASRAVGRSSTGHPELVEG